MRLTLIAAAALALATPALAGPLDATEQHYADWVDATYAVTTLEAGTVPKIDGRDLGEWKGLKADRAMVLKADLAAAASLKLEGDDVRALKKMQEGFAEEPHAPAATSPEAAAAHCDTAKDPRLDEPALSAALYACFERYGNHVPFEGKIIARTTALDLLHQLDTSERRKALFDALAPLWKHLNADDGAKSPYRRLIGLSAEIARKKGGSPVDEGAKTVGASTDEVETWLVAILERWRAANPGPQMEPWDYWSRYASGVRPLDPLIPAERVKDLSFAYYRDLGLDIAATGSIHDLAIRPGKAPLSYADYVRIGRMTPDGWRPALTRVSMNVERGGLFVLNEAVHEDGHVAHFQAVRARPAYYDLGDALFVEAVADVTSWSVADPRWQRKYLGKSIDGATSKRALYADVMLDVSWGLFELQMLKHPDADPNAVWTEITSKYLNIRPHPELSWWALRVQLVDEPGYMINYGLGSVVTADIRARLKQKVGDFDAGNPRWYAYASDHLLHYGEAVETPRLLRKFLGRPVSDKALLAEIGGIGR